ncbi:MAG TPA: DUF1501 domain-containing protein [Allosphingosinicella sp.]|jgi:uncharacterized protein (DUF1501 family)|nr:DUF1501 domain-containing protein [Allosphingosinicella sp.]
MSMDQSRRAFLKRAAAVSIMGGASPFVMNLAAIGEAAAATASDYKALVCVFLFGGNDYANTVTPYDQPSYDLYANLRGTIAHTRDSLAQTILFPNTGLAGGRQYALAPGLLPLIPLFDAGRLAVLLNVGTLIQPTSKTNYTNKSVPLPPKLFSHNDQQSFWQASNPEGATSGWGGRIGDLLQAGNGTATLTCINASGNSVFLSGKTAVQYGVTTTGPVPLLNNGANLFGSAAGMSTLRALMTQPRAHLFEDEHSRVTKRSLDLQAQVSAALGAGPAIATPFPAGNPLADQLRIVARLISVSQELGAKRQVFFVSLGGFDTHDSILTAHPTLMTRLGGGMRAFHDAMVELNIADKVTAFTASDFGRTLTSNANGSDHGWGSIHFAMGGAVHGRDFYGPPPAVANNGPDDVGQGRLLPALSVDQYGATLASWFGVGAGQMPTVLPNINNYNPSTWNLGFV